jgi:hypothetical protein
MDENRVVQADPTAQLIAGSSACALVFAILLVLTYGTGAAFNAIRVVFLVFVSIFHFVSILKLILTANSHALPVKDVLIGSSDLHYWVFFLALTWANLTPILVIFNYFITLSLSLLNYVTDLISRGALNPNEYIEACKRFASHQVVKYAPVAIEITLILQLFIVTVGDLNLPTIATFAFYLIGIVLFNYAVSPVHQQVWSTAATWLRTRADAHRDSYGGMLETAVGKVSAFGDLGIQWYPRAADSEAMLKHV